MNPFTRNDMSSIALSVFNYEPLKSEHSRFPHHLYLQMCTCLTAAATFAEALLYVTVLGLISITGRLASSQSNNTITNFEKDAFVPCEAFSLKPMTPSELEANGLLKKRSSVEVPPHIVRFQIESFQQRAFALTSFN